MFVLLAAAVLVLGLGLMLLTRRQRAGLKPLPGPSGWPLLGNTTQIDQNKFHVNMEEWAGMYGDVFEFSMLGNRMVMLNSLEMLETGCETFPQRPYHIHRLINYDGQGVTWDNNTMVAREAMHAISKLATDQAMVTLFEQELTRFIDAMKESGGRDVDLRQEIERTISRFMMTLVIGQSPTPEDEEALRAHTEQLRELFEGGRHFIMSTFQWLRYMPSFRTTFNDCVRYKEAMIATFVRDLNNGGGQGCGLMERMLERKKEQETEGVETLTDENVWATSVDVLNGSVGPWYTTLSTALLCILSHEDVQERIHAELDQVCRDQPPTDADRHKLPYLQAAVLEGLRFMSIPTTTVPHFAPEDTEFHGYIVHKGTWIFGNLNNLHHAESTWGDPWEFRPERFLDKEGNLLGDDVQPRKYARSFGVGPRWCTGYSVADPYMFRYIAHLMFYFKLSPPAEGELPACDPRKFDYRGTLVIPKITCRFERRAVTPRLSDCPPVVGRPFVNSD